MTIRRKTIRLLLFLFAPSFVFAQERLTGSPITGDIRPIALQPGAETNVVFATLAAGASADDDNNNSLTHPVGGAQYFADPSIAIQETRSHLIWDLSYHPTLRIYVPGFSHPDQFSQVAGGTLHYDVSRRLGISLRQDYLRSSDPFEQFGETPLQPGVGLGIRPGLVALGNFMRTQFLSQAEIDYRLSKHTSVGVSGAFMQFHGEELGGNRTSLINTHDSLGSAFLSHQVTARQAVGLQYEFLDIVFPGRDTRDRTHGVLVFDQVILNQHTSFSIFAGPEYSRIHNQLLVNLLGLVFKIPVSSTQWSASAGAIVDWRRDRFAVQTSFVRRVGDGGGLLGAVEMNDGAVSVKAKLARRWMAEVNAEYTQHTLLNASSVGRRQAFALGSGVGYELAHNLWINAQYQRIHYLDQSSTLQFPDHNRVTLSLKRDFTFPIGR